MTQEDHYMPEATISGSSWPNGIAADAAPEIAFVPAIADEATPTVALVATLRADDRILAESVVWASTYPTVEDAGLRMEWLRAHPCECFLIARRVPLVGIGGISAEIEVGLEIDRVRLEREAVARRAEEERERDEAEAQAEKARRIDSFLVERNGQYGLDMRRGDANRGFYVILFREKWERERFRDWFRWQRHRFAEWAAFLDDHDAVELDRSLLAEMLVTERRIKAEGLSAGGRRPLRFWRGEAA